MLNTDSFFTDSLQAQHNKIIDLLNKLSSNTARQASLQKAVDHFLKLPKSNQDTQDTCDTNVIMAKLVATNTLLKEIKQESNVNFRIALGSLVRYRRDLLDELLLNKNELEICLRKKIQLYFILSEISHEPMKIMFNQMKNSIFSEYDDAATVTKLFSVHEAIRHAEPILSSHHVFCVLEPYLQVDTEFQISNPEGFLKNMIALNNELNSQVFYLNKTNSDYRKTSEFEIILLLKTFCDELVRQVHETKCSVYLGNPANIILDQQALLRRNAEVAKTISGLIQNIDKQLVDMLSLLQKLREATDSNINQYAYIMTVQLAVVASRYTRNTQISSESSPANLCLVSMQKAYGKCKSLLSDQERKDLAQKIKISEALKTFDNLVTQQKSTSRHQL